MFNNSSVIARECECCEHHTRPLRHFLTGVPGVKMSIVLYEQSAVCLELAEEGGVRVGEGEGRR
jgi:hypothetical protein